MKKTFALFIASFMTLCLSASNYGISVKGIQVTDKNISNVTGDGKVSYNPATKTLTLNNIRYYSNGEPTLSIQQNVNIAINGECALIATNSLPISIERCAATFIGSDFMSSTLTTESNNGKASILLDNAGIIFQNITVDASSTTGAGIAGLVTPNTTGTSTLTANNSVIKAKGKESCISNIKSLNLTGCSLDADKGYYFSSCNYGIVNERAKSEIVKGETLRIEPRTYSILVGGIQVSDANASDILGDGKVRLMSYTGSANKYLYIDNAVINSKAGSGIDIQTRFRVDLVFNGKDNVIKGQHHALYSANNSMIQIRSSNTSFSECTDAQIASVCFEVSSGMSCIYVEKTNMSIFNTNINIRNGMYGIKNVAPDYAVLNICNSNVNIAGNSRTAICGFNTPYYTNCYPQGSTFDYSNKAYTSLHADNSNSLIIARGPSLVSENENKAADAYNKAVSNTKTTASIY